MNGQEDGRTLEVSRHPHVRSAARHYLTLVQGPATGASLEVTGHAFVLGRDPERAFHLPDARISRNHCEVRLLGNNLMVRDLGSTNGTFIDGVRVEGPRILPLSARLELGRHVLRHERLTSEDLAQRDQLAQELVRARQYVEAMLPPPRRDGPLLLDWHFVPSSMLGGDAFGYHELPGGRFALYVLDVCGHGVASAMHSATVLHALRAQTLPNTDFGEPGQVLAALNTAFPMEQHGEMYFSIWYGVLEPEAGQLRHAAAGHPPALVRGSDGRIRSRLATRNPPIGTCEGRVFREDLARLERDEELFLYSDGVYEVRDREGHELGLEQMIGRIEAGARPGELTAQAFHRKVCEDAGSAQLEDDFTLLLVRYGTWNSRSPSAPTT